MFVNVRTLGIIRFYCLSIYTSSTLQKQLASSQKPNDIVLEYKRKNP